MKNYEIVLKSIVDVKNFVNITNSYDFEIELESDGHRADAKSIMRIFSLDLSKPITMYAYSENVEDLENKIAPFLKK